MPLTITKVGPSPTTTEATAPVGPPARPAWPRPGVNGAVAAEPADAVALSTAARARQRLDASVLGMANFSRKTLSQQTKLPCGNMAYCASSAATAGLTTRKVTPQGSLPRLHRGCGSTDGAPRRCMSGGLTAICVAWPLLDLVAQHRNEHDLCQPSGRRVTRSTSAYYHSAIWQYAAITIASSRQHVLWCLGALARKRGGWQ
jgi:hypothetical protein